MVVYSKKPQPVFCRCVGTFSAQHLGLIASSSNLRVKHPRGGVFSRLVACFARYVFVVLEFCVVWAALCRPSRLINDMFPLLYSYLLQMLIRLYGNRAVTSTILNFLNKEIIIII